MFVSTKYPQDANEKGTSYRDPWGKHMWNQVSHEKNLDWLGYIGDYTTQLYGDFNKPI